ncbi:MAG: response regulator transcription factor [Turneriella sp.]|nr:response regulator transcription factor [Turneriella sp.]
MSSPSPKTRLILADDHAVFREGMKRMLEDSGSFTVVAQAGDGKALVEKALSTPYDLILTDLSMPNMNGFEAIAEIRKQNPAAKLVVLSMHKDRDLFKKAVQLGIDGYILKEDVFEQMIHCLKTVVSGEKSYSPRLTNFITADYVMRETDELAYEILTKREQEVLRLLGKGQSNKEIADFLDLSVRTVETHRASIMRKMDFHNIQELVTYCIKNLPE